MPENEEVIGDPRRVRPETLLDKLLDLEGSDADTEKSQKENSHEERNSGKANEDMSSKHTRNKILRSPTLSFKESIERETMTDLRENSSYSISMVDKGSSSSELVNELAKCEDFTSFKNATVILLSRMNEEIIGLHRKMDSAPASGHAPPPPPPPPPPSSNAFTKPPLSAVIKKTAWKNMTETKVAPVNFLLDEIRMKQESRNKRTSLKSKYEKLGTSKEKEHES